MLDNKKAYYLFWKIGSLSFSIVLLDQITKIWIRNYLHIGKIVRIFPGLNFHYVNNYGIGFGFFSYPNGWQNTILILINIVFTLLLCWALYKNIETHYSLTYFIGYSLMIGGAFGNLIDRLLYNTVTDFIDVHAFGIHFAIFNVADAAITVGYLLIFWMLSGKKIRVW